MVGGPRSSSPLSLSSPPLVLVSSLASSSLLCFASCPLFVDSSFFTSSTVYSRSFAFTSAFTLPTDTIRGNETIIKSQSRAKDGVARMEKDENESSGGGRKERKRTNTKNGGRNRRDDSPQPLLFFSYLSIRHRDNNDEGAGREVSGGAMTTTPCR